MKLTLRLSAIASILLFAACHPGRHSDENPDSLIARSHRMFLAHVDSLMALDVEVPPPYDNTVFAPTTVTQFYSLAGQTGGKTTFLSQSEEVGNTIIRIIDKELEAKSDVVIMIDKTSSMEDDIANIQLSVSSIIVRLRAKPDVRLAIACYGDKNSDGDQWFQQMPFTTDFDRAKTFVNQITLTYGDDFPESAFDAAARVIDSLEWRADARKTILLLGDAPSLEPPLSDYDLDAIVAKSKAHGVLMNFYPVIISQLIEGQEATPTFVQTELVKKLYPSPNHGDFTVEMTESGHYEYEIYNLAGKKVESGTIDGEYETIYMYEENGLYIFQVIDPEGKKYEQEKFVIQH